MSAGGKVGKKFLPVKTSGYTAIIRIIIIINVLYLSKFNNVGEHDNGGSLLLPDHPPEVLHRLI